ncbi:MAG: hypothetical protein IBJ11_07715 [Phycisphaerales bacterium]|nr:hypothetical protein [Phycisphaerales bacterium]
MPGVTPPATAEPATGATGPAAPSGAAPAAEPKPIPAPVLDNPVAKQTAKLRQLDDAFKAVAAQPIATAEFQPLIDQYEAFKRDVGNDPTTARMRAYADARIELLRLRAQIQQDAREVRGLEEQAKLSQQQVAEIIARLERSRLYRVVGRLDTSAIYDGTRNTLMYRVVAVQGVQPGAGRTIAYIVPNPALGLEKMLGRVVGIKGDGEFDSAARVSIIRPTGADMLLSAEQETQLAPAAASPSAPASQP